MSTLQRLSADALASELSKLPILTAADNSTQNVARLAIARAVASGQDAVELAAKLGGPAGWQGLNLAILPTADEAAATLGWVAEIVPLALAKEGTVRVAVLDRVPSALGGLDGPGWARALVPAATYGPISVQGTGAQSSLSKWIHIYNLTEMVEFVNNGAVLCVAPLFTFQVGLPAEAQLGSGAVWLAANLFDASAPANSYAGVAIDSGTISCDQPLSLNSTVVDIPSGATLSLRLTLTAQPAVPAGFPAQSTAPTIMTVSFPPGGTPTISCGDCSATVYGNVFPDHRFSTRQNLNTLSTRPPSPNLTTRRALDRR